MSYGPMHTLTSEPNHRTQTLGGLVAFMLLFPLFMALLAAPVAVVSAGLGALTALGLDRLRRRRQSGSTAQ